MNRIRVLAATLAFPLVAGAQQATQQAQPPVNPMTQAFKSSSMQYERWLTTAFDSIPESKYGYKPTDAQLTIGNIAQHLESANYSLCSLLGGKTHTMTAKDSLPESVKEKWPKDTLSARLKASFAFCNEALATVNDQNIADMVPVGPPAGGRTVVRMRLGLIYVTDLADHWSQIANYMRLNGLLPPSAYKQPGRGGE